MTVLPAYRTHSDIFIIENFPIKCQNTYIVKCCQKRIWINWTTCELSNWHFYEGFPLNIRFFGEYLESTLITLLSWEKSRIFRQHSPNSQDFSQWQDFWAVFGEWRDSPKIFWRVQWSGFIGQEKGVSRKKEKRLDCDPFEGLFSVFWFRIE